MMIDTRPSARSRATRSRIIAPSLAPIAASGSSSRMMSASELTVRATAIAWRWPPDSFATGTSRRGTFTPIWSSAVRASCFIARFARNGVGPMRSSRLRNMLWKTESSLTSARSWYTQSIPSERAWSTERSSVSSPRTYSVPSSGFWKPDMILISVDFPAPLSPSSPSTSPFFRCRLTSRSAVTGPNRLATFSTRRTSSDTAPPPDAADVHVDDHRDQDSDAEDEVQIVRVDALQGQAVAEDAEEQRAEQGADRRPLPSGQQRAADHRRRNGAEHRLRRARGVGLDRAGAGRLQDPDEPREEAADDEVADHDYAHLHAGLGGAVLVAADRDRVHAPAREREQYL